MSIYIEIKDGWELELLGIIKEYLIASKLTENKIYFVKSYHFKTKFKDLSSRLVIGALGHNEETCLILLSLLRIIIEDKYLFYYCCRTGWDGEGPIHPQNGDKLRLDKIIKRFRKLEYENSIGFSLDQEITFKSTSTGDPDPRKQLHEIDIWTLPRIMATIEAMF